MREIVQWLRTVEHLAYDLYSRSSEFFASDKEFSTFLKQLGQDELRHHQLMGLAADFLATLGSPVVSALKLDATTIDRVESPLRRADALLAAGTLSEDAIIEATVEAETSEWNIIFVYAINTLKALNKVFQHGASVIQAHQDRIEHFLSEHPYGRRRAGEIRRLPNVWEPAFLLVDDDEPFRCLVSELLAKRGVVLTAKDGEEALAHTRVNFFDVVISDIGMPQMNGLDFFRTAATEDPGIGGRFVFCSGEIDEEQARFFENSPIRYLRKPFGVDDLLQMIDAVLAGSFEETDRILPARPKTRSIG